MTKAEYTEQLTQLVNLVITERLKSTQFQSELQVVLFAMYTPSSNAIAVKAIAAKQWYCNTWIAVKNHIATIGATTTLDPQVFADSISAAPL